MRSLPGALPRCPERCAPLQGPEASPNSVVCGEGTQCLKESKPVRHTRTERPTHCGGPMDRMEELPAEEAPASLSPVYTWRYGGASVRLAEDEA